VSSWPRKSGRATGFALGSPNKRVPPVAAVRTLPRRQRCPRRLPLKPITRLRALVIHRPSWVEPARYLTTHREPRLTKRRPRLASGGESRRADARGDRGDASWPWPQAQQDSADADALQTDLVSVLHHQDRRLVGVVVSDVNHSQRPAPSQRDLVSGPPVRDCALQNRRLAGSPSVVSSLNRNPAIPTPSLRLGPNGRGRAYRLSGGRILHAFRRLSALRSRPNVPPTMKKTTAAHRLT
jgi:hypothetical protein